MALRSSDGRSIYNVNRPNPLVRDDWGVRENLSIVNRDGIGEVDVVDHRKGAPLWQQMLQEPPAPAMTHDPMAEPLVPPPPPQPQQQQPAKPKPKLEPVIAKSDIGKNNGEKTTLWGAKALREKRRVIKPAASDPLYAGGFFDGDEEDL